FDVEVIPRTTYRVGGVVLSKERILVEKEQQVLVKYTLEEAHSPTVLRFKPFLAFRNVHELSKANLYANTRYTEIVNGIKMRLYDGYPFLHMQFSKEVEFIAAPEWYYGIEYPKEQNRGYDYKEDLFVPGYFELPIKKGESIIFSASTSEGAPGSFKQKFAREIKKRIPRDTFLGSLMNAAQQFIIRKNQHASIIAGFPWYGIITRQTLVSLPGLTLDLDDISTCEDILDTQVGLLKDGLFPKFPGKIGSFYDSMDAPLWFFWAVQQYYRRVNDSGKIWKQYGPAMKSILAAYKAGTDFNIHMLDNGLIYGKTDNVALTWMDSYIAGKPIVQRGGAPVEVNALWFNALCFALEIARAENDQAFIDEWNELPHLVAKSFIASYWSETREYLADCVDGEQTDWSIRPNMVIAAALRYSPLDREMQKAVLSTVKRELLTPRGLRTLSPRDPHYQGVCHGNYNERELTVHQGTAWPWLISFFVEGYLTIHSRGGLPFVKKIIEGFEEEMTEHCIGTVSEMYNGNPPHTAKGAVSQAWSVAALIHATKLLEKYEE
ncbi:MAG TPA: amylo-alpha-1,6-glucosidase, partial [Prolixibacteraceae bacterium]|nr:amylo-alpha-1,6-glucosidase [Prolixibacteraceae bacterium]